MFRSIVLCASLLAALVLTVEGQGGQGRGGPRCTSKTDLAFVVDSSGSIRDNNRGGVDNWDLVRRFLVDIVNNLDIGPDATQIGIIVYSDIGEIRYNFSNPQNRGQIVSTLSTLRYVGSNTHTAAGLRALRQLFTVANGDRADAANVALVLTDGVSTINPEQTVPEAELAHDHGIQVFSIGITTLIDRNELVNIASPPRVENQNFFLSANFNELTRILEVVTSQVCPTQAPVCEAIVDLCFIIDSSGSIRDNNPPDGSFDNWALLLSFVSDIVQLFPIGQSRTRVAVVVFSDTGTVLFNLNRYDSRQEVQDAISRITYIGSNTNTAGGLDAARTEVFTQRNGDRPNAQNVAIVLTDGRSTTNNQFTVPSAVRLRNEKSVVVFSIGITTSIDRGELALISSEPQREGQNFFTSDNFEDLGAILNSVTEQACVTPSPTPPVCDIVADFAFVLDGSGSIRDKNPPGGNVDNWDLVLAFVADFIRNLPISRTAIRVGVVVFSDVGSVVIRFNEYFEQGPLVDAVRQIAYPGANTNTSGGLYITLSQLFTVQNGDRPNVDNIVIVLTDGVSTIEPERTIPSAQALQRISRIFSLGVTADINEDELRGISSPPQVLGQNYFTTPDFGLLGNILFGILEQACETTPAPRTTPAPPAN